MKGYLLLQNYPITCMVITVFIQIVISEPMECNCYTSCHNLMKKYLIPWLLCTLCHPLLQQLHAYDPNNIHVIMIFCHNTRSYYGLS
jgi:hypothetical protein